MKNTSKKTFLFILPILIIIFAVSYFFENYVSSYDIQDNSDFFEFDSVESTEFQSENLILGDKTAFVYSTLSRGTSLDNGDEFIIVLGEVTGINSNRYEFSYFQPQIDSEILSDEYINIFDYPQLELKSGDTYYGSVYVGTVPIDCESVEIQGHQATLVEQSFDLNGETANFYLYYCAVEESEYPDSVSVICETKTGETFDIVTEKY